MSKINLEVRKGKFYKNPFQNDVALDYSSIRELFPQTRYCGSKLRLIGWIAQSLDIYDYDTVLDAFGGTTTVYAIRCKC